MRLPVCSGGGVRWNILDRRGNATHDLPDARFLDFLVTRRGDAVDDIAGIGATICWGARHRHDDQPLKGPFAEVRRRRAFAKSVSIAYFLGADLQSHNEKRNTVNNQLEDGNQLEDNVQELEFTNDDLINLLAGADTATIFLNTGWQVEPPLRIHLSDFSR